MSRFTLKRRIIVLMLLVYSILIYEIFHAPILRLEGLLGIFVFAELSVIAYVPVYFKNFRSWKRPKNSEDALLPDEISDLIVKAGMKQIHVKTVPKFESAVSTQHTIYLGEELIKRFYLGMILAVVAHELGHIKGRHSTLSVLVIYLLVALVFSVVTGPPIIVVLAIFGIVILALIPINWHFERISDDYAVKLVGREEMKSALTALGENFGYGSDSETHPSIKRRLARLDKGEN